MINKELKVKSITFKRKGYESFTVRPWAYFFVPMGAIKYAHERTEQSILLSTLMFAASSFIVNIIAPNYIAKELKKEYNG